MTKLSPVSWKKFEKFLFFAGCSFEREKGDHRIYWREGLIRPIVIPKEKNLPIFIIRNNLRTLGMTIEEYMEILKNL
jgi:predicted RNA binding protein YcfA (HicA-like mRNA interferase family)